jgi:hypothetical protein
MLRRKVSLDALWNSALTSHPPFQPDSLQNIPSAARRYLEHAIAPNTPLASAVRLHMHGEIKLKNWLPFKAEQVICWQRGMIWQASTWMNAWPIALPIIGADQIVSGEGAMQWKLLGLFPVMQAAGADVTRSAVGRMQGEYIWLPSALCMRDHKGNRGCQSDVIWTGVDETHAIAQLTLFGETTHLALTLSNTGQLQQAHFQRWGNPEGGKHHYENFGVQVQAEGSFAGYTIPTRIRAGWFFGSDRFESEGEFFRATIDQAVYA